MATQFLQGILTVYINSTMVITSEEAPYTLPQVLYNYAESNSGPLENVLSWNKEAGSLTLTMVNYSGLDYIGLFQDNEYFNISVSLRSGDSLILTNALLAETPNHNSVAGTTEVRFRCMNMNYTINN